MNDIAMELVKIKDEPIDDDDVPVKVEPSDDSESNCRYVLLDGNFKVKVEIKNEEDKTISITEDDYMSPSPSNPLSPESTCRVVILEQPVKKVRFRYLSELQGTPHGPLLGEKSSKNNKTFPKVQLVGYDEREPVKMRCWLVDKTEVRGEVRPHCHDLVMRKCIPKGDIVSEPHEVCISRENNFTAVFENMVVLHCVQKDSESKYFDKVVKWSSGNLPTPVMNSKFDKKKIREKIKEINKNEVCLFFEAYIEYRNSVVVLASALSNAIKNLKNPVSGDLKICRALNNYGPVDGDTEVALFTEKVPQDIKVKFSCDDPQWEAIVSPEYMHRHVALTFRTPKFPFTIDDNVSVKYCLYREYDRVESNEMDFTYQPSEVMLRGIGTKRRRLMQISSTSFDNSDSNSSHTESSMETSIMELGDIITDQIPDSFIPIIGEDSNYLIELLSPSQSCGDTNNSGDLNKLLGDDCDDSNLEHFSGSSLVAALNSGDNDPLIGGFSRVKDQKMFEFDGPISATNAQLIRHPIIRRYPKKVSGMADLFSDCTVVRDIDPSIRSSKPIQRSEMAEPIYLNLDGTEIKEPKKPTDSLIMKIIRNIQVTKVYKNHVNVLQKTVILGRVDALKKILSQISKFVKMPNDQMSHKQRMKLLETILKIRDDKYKTLLHTAVLLERKDMFQILVDFGYSPLDKDHRGNNGFHLSVLHTTYPTLQALVSSCVESNSSKQSAVRTTLQQEGVLKTKLQPEVLSIPNLEGQNILHMAVRSSSIDMVNYIVGLKLIDIKSQVPNSGDAALHIVCRLQKLEMARILIREGADISQMNLQGYSPLHISVSINDHHMAKLLIEEKGDPTQECISLTLEQFNKEEIDNKDPSSKDDNVMPISNDAFALANDLMMVDILSGKLKSFTLSEDLHKPSAMEANEGILLTPEQVDKLSEVLAENDSWKLVVKHLNKPYLERLQKGFKQPERILLDYIIRKRNDILGDEDQLDQLTKIFASLGLHKAKEILVSK